MNWNYYGAVGTEPPWVQAAIGLWDSTGSHIETPGAGYRTTTQELLHRIVETYRSPGKKLRIIFISCGEFNSGNAAYDSYLKRLANSALFIPNPTTGETIKLATYLPEVLSAQLEALSRHASSENLTSAISLMRVGGKRRTYCYRSKYSKLKRRQSKKISRSKTRR
jgi:primosomal protein N''